jgi:hypothetical protein
MYGIYESLTSVHGVFVLAADPGEGACALATTAWKLAPLADARYMLT